MPQFLIREFTDSTGHIHQNIEKASKFKDVKECKKIAKQCKGKVLYDSPNWEVV